jgi:hypothetical protein
MSVLERPHYVIKPAELAKWLDEEEPDTWWIVDGDPRLMRKVDFPCPSGELAEALRGFHKDLFMYPGKGAATGSQPAGQSIEWQSPGDFFEQDNPHKRRTALLSWSDRRDFEWLLVEYPSSKISELST